MKDGIYIEELKFVQTHSNGVCRLYAQVDTKEITIQTTNSADDSQHDFSLKRDEWEVFKRVIDIQLKREEEHK